MTVTTSAQRPATIADRVKRALADHIGSPVDDVAQTFRSLGFDDLDEVEFVMKLEDEFAIEIPDDDCWNDGIAIFVGGGPFVWQNVQDAISYITRRVAEEQQTPAA